MTQYKIFNETCYPGETPDAVIEVLERVRASRQRVVLYYGDTKTGKEWAAAVPDRGRIGRSTGENKIPLLVKTARSLGGEALLPQYILRITESSGAQRALYRHPSYNG